MRVYVCVCTCVCACVQDAARDVEFPRAVREVGGADRLVLGDDTLPFPQQSMLQEDMSLTYHPVLQRYANQAQPHGLSEAPECPLFAYVLRADVYLPSVPSTCWPAVNPRSHSILCPLPAA